MGKRQADKQITEADLNSEEDVTRRHSLTIRIGGFQSQQRGGRG